MVAQQTLTLFVRVRILLPQPYFFEVWLSLVERYVRDVEAAGSTPVTSTIVEYVDLNVCILFRFT